MTLNCCFPHIKIFKFNSIKFQVILYLTLDSKHLYRYSTQDFKNYNYDNVINKFYSLSDCRLWTAATLYYELKLRSTYIGGSDWQAPTIESPSEEKISKSTLWEVWNNYFTYTPTMASIMNFLLYIWNNNTISQSL